MSTVFFTSDPHFGHPKVAELRGFSSPDAHDAALMENFREALGPNDITWWLGDLATKQHEYALDLIGSLPGEHRLIWGNHDAGNPMFRSATEWQMRYWEVFTLAQPFAQIKHGGHQMLLSHYPYADQPDADRGEVRHTQYRLPNMGAWLLHGHTHMKDQRQHGKQIHVGVDSRGLKPVPLEQVLREINAYERDAHEFESRSAVSALV